MRRVFPHLAYPFVKNAPHSAAEVPPHDDPDTAASHEALAGGEAIFRAVLDNMSEGLMLFDRERNLIYQNPASLRIHGFSVQEDGRIDHDALGATWDAWDEAGQPVGFDGWPVSRVFAGEQVKNQVLRVIRRETGFEFYGSYNGAPLLDEAGQLRFGFIRIRDITEQVHAREALRHSERRLRAFFESDMMGAFYWNVGGQITDANDELLRMLG